MKTVFHKSGGRQMYQSAARSFRKESTASCRFLQEFIWAQAVRAALRRLPRHSAAWLFLPAEVDRLLGQHELEHQVVAGRGNAVLTAEAADSAGDDTDLGLAVMRDVLHHGADGLISHARDLIGVLQLGVMVERAAAGVRHDDGLCLASTSWSIRSLQGVGMPCSRPRRQTAPVMIRISVSR